MAAALRGLRDLFFSIAMNEDSLLDLDGVLSPRQLLLGRPLQIFLCLGQVDEQRISWISLITL